ncbi:MAG: hypothetical protein AAF907_07380 [Planctomycetota bacterium]
MTDTESLRLRTAGLFLLHALGVACHIGVEAMFLPFKLDALSETEAAEARAMLTAEWIGWAVAGLLTAVALPPFLLLISESRPARWAAAVLGGLVVLMLALDYVGHMVEGDVAGSLGALLTGTVPGVVAVLFALRYAGLRSADEPSPSADEALA